MATVLNSPKSELIRRSDPPLVRSVVPVLSRAGWYCHTKAWLDFLFAMIMLAMAAPVVLVAALAIKLTSRGPIFYSQLRVGHRGQLFRIYKLRTMTDNCEHWSGPQWSSGAGDPRVTYVGWFLRKTHLDELPQLWNVLRGDMSLVGPRPERPEFTPALEQSIPGYGDRLAVRPGLTGLAQVQLPADTDLDSVRRKLKYDLYYIENRGFWLDFRLILTTALKVAHIPFFVAQKLFRIPASRTVEPSVPRQEIADFRPALAAPAAARLQPDGAV